MKERKHIDRLYQEKFRDFEASPGEHVWQKISDRIQQKKKQRILPFWYRIAGTAAIFALLFNASNFIFTPQQAAVPVVNTNQDLFKVPQENKVAPSSGLVNEGNEAEAFVEDFFNFEKTESFSTGGTFSSEEKRNLSDYSVPTQKNSEQEEEISAIVFMKPKGTIGAQGNFYLARIEQKENAQPDAESLALNPLVQLQAEKNSEKDLNISQNTSKVRVSTFAAPIYFDGFGNSSIDPRFADNKSKGEVTMSYGVKLAYTISDKIKIRSGVSRVAMSYNTMDVMYSSSQNTATLRNIDYAYSGNSIQVQDASGITSGGKTNSEVDAIVMESNLGYLNQRFGFIEVPLEVEFVLVDKKLGVNLVGGASTLILSENLVSVNSGDNSVELGKNNNLNPLSFSTNIGMGVNYKLSDKFQINLEPMFKYQINTFSSGDVKPYYMGIYSGFSYKF